MANRATILLAAATVLIAGITIAFGATGYALNGYHDAVFFMPAAVSVAGGHGLNNPLTDTRTSWGDPTGGDRYLYFPPLWPLLIGSLTSRAIPIPFPQQAMLIAGILAGVTALLIAFFFYKIATLNGRSFTMYGAVLISAVLVIMFRAAWNMMARPETFEGLLLITACLVAWYARRQWHILTCFAVVVGIMPAIHPFGAMFAPLLVGLYYAARYPFRRAAASIVAVYGFAFIAYVLVMQCSPYGIIETLQGVSRHANLEVAKIGIQNTLVFLKSPYALSYGIVMLFLAAGCVRLMRRYRNAVRSFPLFLFFALLMVGLMTQMVVLGTKTYYAMLFSIIIFAVMIFYLVHVVADRRLTSLALAFLIFFAGISLKPVLAFPGYLRSGVSIGDARSAFNAIAAQYPQHEIFAAPTLWVVSDEYQRMHYLGDILPSVPLPGKRIVLLDRNYLRGSDSFALEIPKEAEGCPPVADALARGVPRLFGVELAKTVPGYGFVAYVCE